MTGSGSRRDFLGAAAGAGLASAKVPGSATTRILGANDRINVAFIGCGMRFQALLRTFQARKEARNDVHFAAVCDVWEPRLTFAQEQARAEKACRDYRDLIARPDIDGVVVIVPDHAHYRLASEALLAGKDVYVEKPMTLTVDEAAKLNSLVERTRKIVQVGGSGPASPLYWKVNEYIRAGKMGKILWAQISYNRNTRTGMWDYPIPGTGDKPWPDAKVSPGRNLDWKMWLGPARARPYSAERYFRWRKYWEYSGGNATDLLYHVLGTLSTMLGFDFPTRAMAAGGIYAQKNREVPDTYMTMVEYPGEYVVNMVSCMGNGTSPPATVYGNWGTLQLVSGSRQAGSRSGSAAVIKAQPQFLAEFREANEGKTEVTIEGERGTDLVDDWLDCMRSRRAPVYNALRGYQVMTAIKLGTDSYRYGRVMAFDPKTRRVLPAAPPHRKYPPHGA